MCSHPPDRRHRAGYCSLDLIEDIQFLAAQDGVPRDDTIVGYPISYRRQLADRFGMSRTTLDRSLYRAARAVE